MTLTAYYHAQQGNSGFIFGETGRSFFKTQVQETTNSDLYLIYHHLQQGKTIELVQYVKDGNVLVGAYFKGFKIGSLSETVSKILLANIARGKKISAYIKAIDRKKFLPPSQIELEVVVQ